MPSSEFKGFKLTHITIPKGLSKKEIPAYVQAGLPSRFQNVNIEKLLADPNLKITMTDQQMPKLTTRIHSYVTALKEWREAGKPIRSDEEVERIFEFFCSKCKSHKKNRCLFCGCRIAINGHPITNKIKMATEHCPKELW